MYLAQDQLINSSFLDSLSKIGPFGLLCFVVIAFIWLVIKLNSNTSKNTQVTQQLTDVQSKVVETKASDNQTFIDAISNLTKIVMSQQTRMDSYDRSFSLMAEGVNQQNRLLSDIKDYQSSGNEYTRTLHAALVSINNDTSSAIGVMSDHIGKQVIGVEATISARLDSMPERIASRVSQTNVLHAVEIKTLIVERTKSIEDLFVKIIRDNEDLTEIVKLRDDTIQAMTARISALETPTPPDPPPSPDGSGAKMSVPLDNTDTPDLSRSERAA